MMVRRPVVRVVLGSQVVKPSSMRVQSHLNTLPTAMILLSGDNRISLSAGDDAVMYVDDARLFTGVVLGMDNVRGGLGVRCGYGACSWVSNFRMEMARYVYSDLADRMGLPCDTMDVPDVELEHFHCEGNGWANILAFTATLNAMGENHLDVVLNREGRLRLLPETEQDPVAKFSRGKNAYQANSQYVKAPPIAVGAGEYISVDGKLRRVLGSECSIRPRNAEMVLSL